MALIFYLSHQPATQLNQLSKRLTGKIVEAKGKVTSSTNVNINSLHSSIRDNAHFFLYLVLGALILNALGGIGLKGIIIALFICILYAISDEVHQTFIPGKGAEVKEILIDTAGAATGIFLYLLSSKIVKMSTNIKRTIQPQIPGGFIPYNSWDLPLSPHLAYKWHGE